MTDHPDPRGELFDLGLRLLDRQLVGSEDELLGNVDNVLLETVDDELAVTALISGPAGLGPRFGGRTDVWMRSIWRRLRPERDPAPVVIPMTHVVSVGSAVTLDDHAQRLVAEGGELERWLRYYLIGRIPGATGGPDRLAGEPVGTLQPDEPPPSRPPVDGHLLSELIGAAVLQDGSSVGVVLDVLSEPPHAGRHRVGALPLRALLYGRRRLGAEMGYATQRDQGPWLIAAPVRAWHREDRVVPVDDVRVDWEQHSVTVARPDRAHHPHDRPGSP